MRLAVRQFRSAQTRTRTGPCRAASAARALDVSIDYLYGLTKNPTPADRLAKELAAADPWYAVDTPDDPDAPAEAGSDGDYIGVSELASAGGSGAVVEDERVTGRLKFRQAWLAPHGLVARYCRVIHVLGESMEPTMVDGCVILVNRARRRPRSSARLRGLYGSSCEEHAEASGESPRRRRSRAHALDVCKT